MLLSLGLLWICGFWLGRLFTRLSLPPLIGMLCAGMALGGSGFGLLHPDLSAISSEIRQFALIIILCKAGSTLKPSELRAVGRPCLLLGCLPALFEMIAVTLIAPLLLPLSHLEGLLLGAVLSAVSPAVVVPSMVSLIENGYGKVKKIPQIILAGASLDDVFVITLFSCSLGLVQGEGFSPTALLQIPISIVIGVILGVLCGFQLSKLAPRLTNPQLVVLLLGFSLVLVGLEDADFAPPFSALLAVMTAAITLTARTKPSKNLGKQFTALWSGAEILLFGLVGAQLDLSYLGAVGGDAVLLLSLCLCIRSLGVLLSLVGTDLAPRERFFCTLAYLPKATVQAAIGGIPLALGLPCGELILAIAVLAIFITAPLGAIAITKTAPILLQNDKK